MAPEAYACQDTEPALTPRTFGRDCWGAQRLGAPVPVGHRRVPFEPITQPWLTVPRWRLGSGRLANGMSVGAVRRDATAMSTFAIWVARTHLGAADASVITRAVIEGLPAARGGARAGRQGCRAS